MNKAQKAHSKHIRDTFAKLQEAKFLKGAEEHGTILNELDPLWLLEQAREEFIDGFTYVQTVIDLLDDQITIDVKKGSKMDKFLRSMLEDDTWISTKIPKNTTDKSDPK